jgi:hypothetical protein
MDGPKRKPNEKTKEGVGQEQQQSTQPERERREAHWRMRMTLLHAWWAATILFARRRKAGELLPWVDQLITNAHAASYDFSPFLHLATKSPSPQAMLITPIKKGMSHLSLCPQPPRSVQRTR